MKIRKFFKIVAFSTVAFASSVNLLMAETTLSSLNQPEGGWYPLNVGLDWGGSSLGQSFLVEGEWRLNSVTLGMLGSMTAGTEPTGEFTVSIYSGNAGELPGLKLATLVGNSNPYQAGNYTYTASEEIKLTSGQQYWIVMSVPNYGNDYGYQFRLTDGMSFDTQVPGWTINPTDNLAVSSDDFATGSLFNTGDFGGNMAFSIDAIVVPEPSITAILIIGAPVLIGLSRLRKIGQPIA